MRGVWILLLALWAATAVFGNQAHAQIVPAVSANPATFSAAGQSIALTVVLASPGGTDNKTNVGVTDSKGDTYTCPTGTLFPGNSFTCTGTYITTAADVAGGSVTITVTYAALNTDGPETFSTDFTIGLRRGSPALAQLLIGQFMAHHVSLLVANEPDRPRLIRRSPGLLWGGDGPETTPFSFTGDANGSNVSFATSMLRMAQASARADERNAALAAAPGGVPGAVPVKSPRSIVQSNWDVWLEAHYSRFGGQSGDSSFNGDFGIAYLGADYLVNPSLLVGALVQFDMMTEKHNSLNATLRGQGTMAGPYVSMRLADELYLDMRAAWGRGDNRVNPDGTYEDKFNTDRWLASGKLTANWHWQDVRITPSAGVVYVSEQQRSYTDSFGNPMPAQTVALGRFTFGPEIARRFVASDGTVYEPQIALNGMWDFYKTDLAPVVGLTSASDRIFAGAKAALMARAPSGMSMRVAVSYDGIGARDFHDLGAQVWVNVPLH